MQINSVSSAVNTVASIQSQTQTTRATEVENDKDKDDVSAKAAAQTAQAAQQRPTVNTSGESIGSLINIQA